MSKIIDGSIKTKLYRPVDDQSTNLEHVLPETTADQVKFEDKEDLELKWSKLKNGNIEIDGVSLIEVLKNLRYDLDHLPSNPNNITNLQSQIANLSSKILKLENDLILGNSSSGNININNIVTSDNLNNLVGHPHNEFNGELNNVYEKTQKVTADSLRTRIDIANGNHIVLDAKVRTTVTFLNSDTTTDHVRTILLVITGGNNIIWGDTVKWCYGITPTFSEGTDMVSLIRWSNGVYYGLLVGTEFA